MSKPIECTAPRVNAKVNYGLWVIMMCQCRFTSCNKCTTLVERVDSGGSSVCVEAGVRWELSNFLLNFAVNLKNSPFKNQNKTLVVCFL